MVTKMLLLAKHKIFRISNYLMIMLIVLLPGCSRFYQDKFFKAKPAKKTASTQSSKSSNEKSTEPVKGLLSKSIKTMNVDELRKALSYVQNEGNKDLAVKYLERIILLSNDQEELKNARLDLANLYYELENFKKAYIHYNNYAKFYPGSAETDLAEYRAINCHFKETPEPFRDQASTRETLELAQSYLHTNRLDKKFEQEVRTIAKECRKKLFDHEMHVFIHYLIQDSLQAAQGRLDTMKRDYLPTLPEVKQQVLECERDLALKQGKTELAASKQTELAMLDQQKNINLASNSAKIDYARRF